MKKSTLKFDGRSRLERRAETHFLKAETFFIIIQTKHIDKFIVLNFMVRHTESTHKLNSLCFSFRGFFFYSENLCEVTFCFVAQEIPRGKRLSFLARTL